ncbi:MAG: hypothetical protein PUG31_01635 [Eubacteriales bacterium]|jgi:hypothetical protein|nr:hypothetical protein [Eubacteriales bacterium]
MEVLLIPNRFRASGTAHNHFCFQQIHMPLIPVKIKIAFVAAAPYRALPLKDDAAHVSIDTVIAQAESARQLFAAQQLAILHIGALQNIDPVTPAVGFNFFEFETCISAEHSADHLVENLKEKRADEGNLRCSMQTLPIRLYPYSYGFFYQSYGFFPWDISDHLQINGRSRENHPFRMYPFLFRQVFIFAAQFVAKLYRIVHQNIRLFPADLLVQFAQEISEAAEFFIIFFIDHISMLLCLCKFEFIMIFSEIPMFQGIFRVKCPTLMCFSLFCPYGQKQGKVVSDKKQSACWILIDRDSFSLL